MNAVINLRKNASDASIEISQAALMAASKLALENQENTTFYLHLGGICRWGVMDGEFTSWGYGSNDIKLTLCGQAEYAEKR